MASPSNSVPLIAILLLAPALASAEGPEVARRTAWAGLVQSSLSPLEAGILEEAIVSALTKDARLLVVDAAGHPLGAAAEKAELGRAEALKREGVDLMLHGRYDAAKERLEQAVLLFESELLATSDHSVLHDALLAEAEALMEGGQRQQAKTMLRRLAALKPAVVPTTKTHSPGFVELWEEAKKSLGPVGRLAITSDPPGAEIILDGNKEGKAPLELKVLPGTHAVAVVHRDLVVLGTAQVASGKRTEFKVSRKGPADELRRDVLDVAARRIGEGAVAEHVVKLGTMAAAEEVLIATVREEDGGLVLALARHGSNGRVVRAAVGKHTLAGADGEAGFQLGPLLDALYRKGGGADGAVVEGDRATPYPGLGAALYTLGKNITTPPAVAAAKVGPDLAPTEVPKDELHLGPAPPPPPTPLTEQWWFWGLLGAAVAGGTIGIIAATRPAPSHTVLDIVLPSSGSR
ncbi:MAG: PEGA domain-containing protein [Myxococcota bacterium]